MAVKKGTGSRMPSDPLTGLEHRIKLVCPHLNNTYSCWEMCVCGHPCCGHRHEKTNDCLAGHCPCMSFRQAPVQLQPQGVDYG